MKLQRVAYRWGFSQPDEETDVKHGVVEIQHADGRVEELEVKDVKMVTIHERLED